MTPARRSAHDAPRWYRRIFFSTRRSARQSVVQPFTPTSLSMREQITMIALALLGMLAVVVVVAAISYSHMYDWAKANAEPEWRARLSPISADGAILAASIVMYVDARMRHRADWLAYVIVVSNILWSVFANVVHDWSSPVAAKLIAGWPPVTLAATVELLLRFSRRLRERSDELARIEHERIERERADEIARQAELTRIEQGRVEQARADEIARQAELARIEREQAEQAAVEQAKQERTERLARERAERLAAKQETAAPVADPDSLTQEMSDAGWAPSDYRTVGDAMLGYLAKVDPAATGADLHRLVAVPFFGADPDNDTGRGRQIVRQFKTAQATAGTTGKE